LYHTTWDHNPEDSVVHSYCCGNLKSHFSGILRTFHLTENNSVSWYIKQQLINCLDNIGSKYWMITKDKLTRTWKKKVMGYFKALFPYLPLKFLART
jgi:hypothetical protein